MRERVPLTIDTDIADVTYFVEHDSLLDIEARARSTTVYLADRRTDMLPAILSERMLAICLYVSLTLANRTLLLTRRARASRCISILDVQQEAGNCSHLVWYDIMLGTHIVTHIPPPLQEGLL